MLILQLPRCVWLTESGSEFKAPPLSGTFGEKTLCWLITRRMSETVRTIRIRFKDYGDDGESLTKLKVFQRKINFVQTTGGKRANWLAPLSAGRRGDLAFDCQPRQGKKSDLGWTFWDVTQLEMDQFRRPVSWSEWARNLIAAREFNKSQRVVKLNRID